MGRTLPGCIAAFAAVASALRVATPSAPHGRRCASPSCVASLEAPVADKISAEAPLHVLIAGAGVGGLALANQLELSNSNVKYTVLERTSEFRKFGGPIQLASNAMQTLKNMDASLYSEIEARATWTGNRTNGIKDGIRNEWYAKFDLETPARDRAMPYTCVVERPELQEIMMRRTNDHIRTSAGVESYVEHADGRVTATLSDGEEVTGDVLIGADGIWSNVRASMTDTPARGDESGVSYSGYTVFAGELEYSKDKEGAVLGPDPACGYKVYIGPQKYFVITDIGRGRYQWYAFLARPADSEQNEEKPDGQSMYLQTLFSGWSDEIHDILRVTTEDEIEQRDLYDRPPSVLKPWTKGHVALLGDAIHAMMPNLGQGGCQAIEDATVIGDKLTSLSHRSEVTAALSDYRDTRLTRSAAVQGLSRFASDIIIRGFDTPCKLGWYDGAFVAENVNYAGVVTRLLQPVLPVFFAVQFAFLYDGWDNKWSPANARLGLGIGAFGVTVLALFAATAGAEVAFLGAGLEALVGIEAAEGLSLWLAEQSATVQEIINSVGGGAGL